YIPMAGIQLAFKNYSIKKGIWGSKWIGFDHFERFFSSFNFQDLLLNTISISVYCLILGTVLPIIFSLMINYVRSKRAKKALQMVTYLPYFISTVVLVGMLQLFLGDAGMVNVVLNLFGHESISFLSSPSMFKGVYAWSGAWQGLGFSSVIYIAALAGVDTQIHEAAIVDGASIWQRIWHIDLTEITPTILVLLIMGLGGIINVGYEKILLMQNQLNFSASDVISTYVYRIGLVNSDYGYSTAVGLFNSVISMVLLFVANRASKKIAGFSMW
ncbi:MAG: ABC transporter permease subunit, partial [Angelakisella sp.]